MTCKYILYFILLFCVSNCNSQIVKSNTRLERIYDSYFKCDMKSDTIKYEPSNYKSYSELSIISTSIILIYKKYISTQDSQVCNFTVSCSTFGLNAIKSSGFFQGCLITGDRLLRCNSLAKQYYSIDANSKLAIDYPAKYYK